MRILTTTNRVKLSGLLEIAYSKEPANKSPEPIHIQDSNYVGRTGYF